MAAATNSSSNSLLSALDRDPRTDLRLGRARIQFGGRSGKRLCTTTIKCVHEGEEHARRSGRTSDVNRREFVLGSIGGGAAATLPAAGALANPVELGSISSCSPAELPPGATPVNCCPPPNSSPIVDFQYNTRLPQRLRRPAHLLRPDEIARYNRAYQLMRALPASDPRRFSQQANVHCAYCNDSFRQANSRSELQIHDSWLFLPWHRWYLYFHERILGKLLGDDTFALPFWNWDNQAAGSPLANVIPSAYLNQAPLIDSLRNQQHLPPRLVDLNYSGQDSGPIPPDSTQRAENNALMFQQIVSGSRTPSLFFGQAYRAGDANAPGGGTIENAPHGTVHVWTGSAAAPNREDMGTLYSAARDPIFFAHHGNIDRLWVVWKTLPGGRRRDPTDTDWLDAKFLFYDENSRLVRVRVRDALTTEQLGYSYQDTGNAWASARPTIVAGARNLVSNAAVDSPAVAAAAGDDDDDGIEEFGEATEGRVKKLEDVFKSKVKRPIKEDLAKIKEKLRIGKKEEEEDDEEEEVLVIQGVEIDCDRATKFDVYINLPGADENTSCNVAEYAGTFVNVPHFGDRRGGPGHMRTTDLRLGISDTLDQLGIKDARNIVVTLVPRGVGRLDPIKFKGFKIEYE
ncbi:polyphenol oxidase I, chloroplastic [Selaginella moellendorffii]|uniref:polyphenol oxidase I, chloroplastic n=1 Tax=Selaginella moellendorffii TaxID=88036 RepID=UPI000D1CCC0D|nr:polyphenol oxidase I, chloroplastic [Selaginella moellendorffii]|eukprot:XP_024540745.1 polyphenol oxidase I, chloroplastic [Selaginella moellendorffii]